MTDDNLDDVQKAKRKPMQDKTGGYCPMCDTVWAAPGKCRCEPIENKAKRKPCGCYGPAHRPECKEIVGIKGQYGKFNTEPTTYSKDFAEQFMNKVEMSKEDKMLYDMAWNAAIEAAACVIDQCNRAGPYQAIGGAKKIRELKK